MLAAILPAVANAAGPSTDDMNASNNPLTPMVYNLFAEPQWTVGHEGVGVPKFQVFMGLNIQFPL